jgi:GAF domain-containing protein
VAADTNDWRGGNAVNADRRARLHVMLEGREGVADRLRGVCELCVSELAVSGARVQVLGGVAADGGGALVYATDELGLRLEDLAVTSGVAPCFDAFNHRHPLLVPDLALEQFRWPGFAAEALDAGIAALFTFPLQIGGARLGVLELHREKAGALSPDQLADALLLSDEATETILDDLDGMRPMELPGMVDIQAEVHQATGFVSVDLGVSLNEALLRIRGHAFAHRLTLTDVARQIIERRLRLDDGE